MKRDPQVYIDHMLESIENIQHYTEEIDFETLLVDTKTQDSVVHRMQLLGQSAKNLPEDIRENHPEIPWRQIIGMRNIIVHEYLGLDLAEVWNVIGQDLPELEEQLKKIIR